MSITFNGSQKADWSAVFFAAPSRLVFPQQKKHSFTKKSHVQALNMSLMPIHRECKNKISIAYTTWSQWPLYKQPFLVILFTSSICCLLNLNKKIFTTATTKSKNETEIRTNDNHSSMEHLRNNRFTQINTTDCKRQLIFSVYVRR